MPLGAGTVWYVLSRVLIAAAVGAFLGWVFGSVVWGIVVALGAYLAWHLWTLITLDNWLRHRRVSDPPDASGLWGDVVTQVVRLHRRKRFHKDRLVRVFRELRRTTAAMPDGVVVLNGENEIGWFNQKASELLDLTRRADLGIRIDNLVRHPDFVRYLRSGQYHSPVIVHLDPAADEHLSFQLIPYGEDQRLLMVRDVSRQVRLEAMRKDFVANASHELRSPLTVIAGYLETLGGDPTLPAELKGPLGEMRRQSDRMTHIIEDLLALSRLEQSDEPVEGAPINVAAIVAMLRKDVLGRPGQSAKVEVHADSSVSLIGDEAMIHSAFSNLVDNAVKYTPANGHIEVRWWADERGAHFSVKDTGVGIPSEHLPRLTERFYRVDAARGRGTGGSGIGLAIVKHVLQRHGAELEVTSREGAGSTFVCHFPASRIVRDVTRVAAG
jgi:two-component system, OmpR family, phosphate regulon sensor histidine kinase PhoR